MSDTLVLNRNFYAVHIMGWQRAMSLLFTGHAEALDENLLPYNFEDWKELSAAMTAHPGGFVHTPTYKLAVPDIIRLKRFDTLPRGEVKFTRKNIYEHYRHKCGYCGRQFRTAELNLDHIVPRSKGGPTNWSNIITACIPCNTRKDDKTPEQAGMRLLVKPSKPEWRGAQSLLSISMPIKVKASWQKVIDTSYWDTELEKN